MKKIAFLSCLAIALMGISLAAKADVVTGLIFKEAQEPGLGSGSVNVCRVGEATCKSYFGIVALGDCSTTTAMKKGKITNLSHVDTDVLNILGYKVVKVKAYGN